MKDDRLYLIYVLEGIRRIETYTHDGKKTFLADEAIQDAVLRNLHTLCEATEHLSDACKARYDHIPWRVLRMYRNVIVHAYLGLDMRLVWEVVELHLPPLKTHFQEIYDDLK